MDRENWNVDLDLQDNMTDTDPVNYSVEEILSQFWLDYSMQETEEDMSERTDAVMTELQEEEPDAMQISGTDDLEWSGQENSFEEPGWETEYSGDPEWEPEYTEEYNEEYDWEENNIGKQGRETENAEKPDRENPAERLKRGLRNSAFSGTVRNTLDKVRKLGIRRRPARAEEEPEKQVKPALHTGFEKGADDLDLAKSVRAEFEEEQLYVKLDSEKAADTSAPSPEVLITESEPELADEESAESLQEPEEETKPEPQKVRKSRKVWEEFPDSVPQETEPAADTIDYSALFRMFAEDAEQKNETVSAEQDLIRKTAEFAGPMFELAEEQPEERKPAHLPREEQADAKEHKKEPLFAEIPEGELDFRDILREFMLGDQHPIYADMPGIGKKAEPVRPAPPEPEEEKPAPRPRREYHVEEEFPLDLTSLSSTPAVEPKPEEIKPEEPDVNTKSEDSEELPEQEKRILKRLLNLGIKPIENKKKALNEPKAFARFEDFIQTDSPEEEKAPDTPPETTPPAELSETDVPQTEQPAETTEAREPTPEEDEEILYSGDFPSFGQWILNELMTLWIRINGIGDRQSTATMEDDAEDLGREVNVANASRYYGSQVTMLRMRFQIGMALLAILAYLTLGFPVTGMLKTAKVSAAMCLGLQLTIMLLCLDVVTNAAVNLTRRKFGADSLAVLFCVITCFEALTVAVGGFGNPHIPLCFFSSLSLMGILLSDLLTSRALRKSTRVPAIGKRVYCVTAEEGVRGGGDLTLLKSVRPTAGFVRRAEEAPPDEALFSRTAAVQLLVALVLSLLTAAVKHSIGDYLYILSAILSCAVPVTALLAFALPFFIGSQRIFSSGAAVAGWSGIHDIGASRNLIVTDRDLFPEDTVSIDTVRIFADDSAERVIGFAGTMIAASGSGLGSCFAELMEKNNCRMRQVEDFRWLAGGGLQGRIEGHTVLCGSSDLMQLMNVKIPYRLVDKTTVLLAIDGVLYGIFKISYTGLPEIRSALQELIASNRHPIFAIRDFNITPEMLHDVFDVATDGYDFPPYGDRFRISEAKPSETSKVSAVICREGLGPLTHLADTGRSMYVAIRLNLLVTAAVAVIGMLLVFVKLIGTGIVSAWLPFVLMLAGAIIVTLISMFMRF